MSELWRDIARQLNVAGIVTPELDARLLVGHATGRSSNDSLTLSGNDVSAGSMSALNTFVARRLEGEPVSRILGHRGFWKHDFVISPDTLDPRPDSETLVELTLKLVDHENWRDKPLSILDLGTGSGCLLISILQELPQARGLGIDISASAVATAQENARRIGCSDRVTFETGSWFNSITGTFDIVISNPPYIQSDSIDTLMKDVKLYDPRAALDGGHDGLDAYRAIISDAGAHLSNGWLVLEGGQDQHDDITRLLDAAGFATRPASLSQARDLNGIIRCVAGKAHCAQTDNIAAFANGI